MAEPCIQGAALDAAFPFYILLDAEGMVHAVGSALQRALPKLKPGEPLKAHMSASRPRSLSQTTDWSQHEGQAVVLSANEAGGLALRGQICRQSNELTLLLLSPVVNRFEDLRRHGLQLSDLALHDATGDMLMLQRAAQTSLDDAQRLTDRLRQRSQQLQLMSELSALGIAYFSDQGELRQSNALFHQLLRWNNGPPSPCHISDVECRLQELAAPHDAARLRLNQLPEPASEGLDAFTMQVKDGQHLALSYRSAAASDHVLFIRDITRETLVDRMKSEFLSTAAHELRTPMTSIFGFSEMLVSRDLKAEQVKSVAATIHKQASWMVSLLQEVLDLARIEARQIDDLNITACDCKEMLIDCIGSYCDAGQQARFDWQWPEQLPLIAADRVKARQALGNVINNAIKYSPAGGAVEIRCFAQTTGGRDGVGISVEDHGIGMTPQQLARVFERFYRADPSCNIPGSGLGMSLVEQIMKLHNGSVHVTSEKGRGTCATLWFPLA